MWVRSFRLGWKDLIFFLEGVWMTSAIIVSAFQKIEEKRAADVGGILTWDMNKAHFKFERDEGEAIKSVTCRVLYSSTVVALQDADEFDPIKHCGARSFKFATNGDLVTLVKTDSDSPFLAVKRIKSVLVTFIKAPDINSGRALIVVNVHFAPGETNGEFRKERLQHLSKNILPSVLSDYSQTQKKDSPLIVVLGSFNLNTEDSAEMALIQQIKVNGDTLVPIIQYKNTDPYTTPAGFRYDNILISSRYVEKGDLEVNLPIFKSAVTTPDSELLGLANNFMVAQYGIDSRTQESKLGKLQRCITSYLESGKFESYDCHSRWTSSVSISNHLPLQLQVKLGNNKDISVGTWNLGKANQRMKLSSPDSIKLIESTLKKFDILVLQEVSNVDDPEVAKLLRRFGILRLVVDSSILEYGIYVNFDRVMVDTKEIMVRIVPFSSTLQNPAARLAVTVSQGGKNLKLCLYDVHLRPGSSEADIREAIDELKADQYSTCDLAMALGDFSTGSTENPDIGTWSDLPIVPIQCYHMENDVAQTDTFTKMTTRQRTDYIFVLSYTDSVSGIGKCELWHTGNDIRDTKIEDWREVSDHYPVSVTL